MFNPFREKIFNKRVAARPEQTHMTIGERNAALTDYQAQLKQILAMREMGDGHPADQEQVKRLEAKIKELGG